MNDELTKNWEKLKKIHKEHLAKFEVKLPKEGTSKQIQLSMLYGAYKKDKLKFLDKNEISKVVREHLPDLAPDQQVRHLKRDGWGLITKTGGKHRLDPYKPGDSFITDLKRSIKIMSAKDFDGIKKAHKNRCVSCGDKEGSKSWRYKEIVKLEQGHKDPAKPHVIGNIIPQCQFCNKQYKGDFVFDNKGRVKAIASINPVKKASKEIQKKVFEFLTEKFALKK